MKTKEIRDLIDFLAQTGLNEVSIETDELKIAIKRDAEGQVIAAPAYASAPAAASPPPAAPAATESSNYVEVKSPMIGTFYTSANPETPAFVSVGDTIRVGQTVCIVEAMKLFNEIESEVKGTIVKVLADNGTPVEYDQPLFLVDPS